MSNFRLTNAIRKMRRKTNVERRIGYLGDGSGEVHDRTRPGNYWVRYDQSLGALSTPVSLPIDVNANLPSSNDLAVEIGERNGKPIILGAHYEGLAAAGINPLQINPADEQVTKFVSQSQITTFQATRHADTTNKPFYAIVLAGWYFDEAGVKQFFPGDEIDLSSLQPSAGNHCYAVVFLKKTDGTLEAFASTAVDIADPLSVVDIQEAVALKSADSMDIWAWELTGDDVELAVDPARVVDLRHPFDGLGDSAVRSIDVAITPTSIFDVTGGPVTGSGTITISMDNQSANTVLAGPTSGGAATPGFRTFDHSELTGLTTGDPHTQYIFNAPTTDTRNVIQPTADTVKGLVIKGFSATQSDNLQEWQDSSAALLSAVGPTGNFGMGTSPGSAVRLNVSYAPTTTSGASYAGDFAITATPGGTPAASTTYRGLRMTASTANDSTDYSASGVVLYGLLNQVNHNGSGTLSNLVAIATSSTTRSGGSGSVTSLQGVGININHQGSGTVGAAYNILIGATTNTGGGTITSLYGLLISNINVGSTNYAIATRAGTVHFNQLGDANTDFIYSGDTLVNLIYGDAGADSVGINTATPGALLDINGFFRWGGMKRVSTQFDKTNTTLANVTGLSVTLVAGKTYHFRAELFETSGAGGHKYAISGTATATAIIYDIETTDLSSQLLDICARATALDTAAGEATGSTHNTLIEGTITVNAGGTLTVQFAQNTAAGGTSSILVGSVFMVWEVA